MKYLFIIFLAVINSLFTTSQAQVSSISLNNKKILSGDHHFFVQEIIDARPDKCNIGYAYVGHDFAKRPVVVEGNFCEAILPMLPRDKSNGKIPVAIKVNKLFYRTFEKKDILYQILEINLSFYTIENNNYYYQFMSGLFLPVLKANPVNHLDKIITDAFEICFNEFIYRMDNGHGYGIFTAVDTIHKNSFFPGIIPRNETYPQEGVYKTFNDFRDNIIDTTTKVSTIDIGYKFANAGFEDFSIDKSKNAWGVVHFGKLYVQVYELFAPVIFTGEKYIINHMLKFNENHGRWDGGYFAGNNYFKYYWHQYVLINIIDGIIHYANRYKIKQEIFEIDPSTGLLLPEGTPTFESLPKELVICLPEKTFFDLEMVINSGEKIALKPFSYYTCVVQPFDHALNLCIRSVEDESCIEIPADFCNKKIIKVAIGRKGQVNINPDPDEKSVSKMIRKIEKGKLQSIHH